MECEVCGRTGIFSKRKIDGKFHCRNCEYELELPKFVVTSPWGISHRGIFDNSNNRVIPGGIKGLERCGFKLYNHKRFLKSTPRFHYSNVYTFRYFGHVICRRLTRTQKIWPKHFPVCVLSCRQEQ